MQIKSSQKRKLLDNSKILKKSNYNDKISELENKIPSISGLVTTSALTAVENKIPIVSNLVNKTNYDTKISELEKKLTDHKHYKYISTPEFKKFLLQDQHKQI